MDKSPGIGRPGTPRRSSAAVRRALLDSAAAVFAQRGYARAGTKEIAHGAGTSETAIYQHFGSKADLFGAAVLEPFSGYLSDYTRAFKAQMASDPDDHEIVRALISTMYDHFHEHRNSLLSLITASGEPEAQSVMEQAVARLNETYAELHELSIERWERGGGFPLERSKIWLRIMAGTMTSLTVLEPMFNPDTDHVGRDELIDTVTDLLLYGLLPERPPTAPPAPSA